MSALNLIGGVLSFALSLYLIVLFARLVMEYIPLFVRGWRPRGALLVVAEVVYTVTDPPIRFFRRLIPPLRVGTFGLDFGFMLTMLCVLILMSLVRTIFG